jgi:hypothetical protein
MVFRENLTTTHITSGDFEITDDGNMDLDRACLVTRQDIRNVEMRYGLRTSRKDPEDHCSVRIWAQELEQSGNLLVYEHQPDTGNFLLGTSCLNQGKTSQLSIACMFEVIIEINCQLHMRFHIVYA